MESQLTSARLDRYYTPEPIAAALVEWAVRSPSDHLLDPSFGGCAFFRTGVATLAKIGAKQPHSQIHGVDVDPEAIQYLRPLLESGAPEANFHFANFFSVSAESLGRQFDVVVGNPPYVRHHAIQSRQYIDLIGRRYDLPRTAGLWAYFVLHALSFVSVGGSLAMVVPGAVLEADYSRLLRQHLCKSFDEVHYVRLPERIFADVEATSVLLLARGRGRGTANARVGACKSTGELSGFLGDLEKGTRSLVSGDYRRDLLSAGPFQEALELTDSLSLRGATVGALGTVSLGVVTGANGTFIVNDKQRLQLIGRREWYRPIIATGKTVKGVAVTQNDLRVMIRAGERCFLLTIPSDEELPPALDDYLFEAENQQIDRRLKCAVRDSWYAIEEVNIPDAFVPYMSDTRLRIVANGAGMTSTNSMHHLVWNEGVSADERLSFAIQSVGSVFQVAAELGGKIYGGGVLKLELRHVRALPLLANTTSKSALQALKGRVDRALRAGEGEAARAIVDEWVSQFIEPKGAVKSCEAALRHLREMRHDVAVTSSGSSKLATA